MILASPACSTCCWAASCLASQLCCLDRRPEKGTTLTVTRWRTPDCHSAAPPVFSARQQWRSRRGETVPNEKKDKVQRFWGGKKNSPKLNSQICKQCLHPYNLHLCQQRTSKTCMHLNFDVISTDHVTPLP